MSNSIKCLAVGCLSSYVLCAQSHAQGVFSDPIPTSSLAVSIEDFATIPDSSTGNNAPARVSVLTRDPSGRIFANDQRGPLYTINSTGSSVTEYLDIRDYSALDIISGSEPGFQSFAFHPDFATPDTAGFGRFYTIHSSGNTSSTPDFDPGGATAFHSLLLEWRTNSPTSNTFVPANPSAPYRELMRLDQPFGNHNTGLVAFNTTVDSAHTDYGNLYVAVGDGGSGNDPQDNGQDPSNPFGALLRIDPLGTSSSNGKYGIVNENVLAKDAAPDTLSEIYAYGLRNPQRFGWDQATGNMYIADIGQSTIEEINLGANGANYGWDIEEGSGSGTSGFIDPVAEYDHSGVVSDFPSGITGGRAITTGEVARGTGFPGFDGQLLLGDFPTGLIFLLDVDDDPLDGGQDGLMELKPLDSSGNPVRLFELINDARSDRGLNATSRADLRFGINTLGEVFITNKRDGIIRRLVFEPTPGDFTGNGIADTEDLAIWAGKFGLAAGATIEDGDADGDSDVDGADFLFWQKQFADSQQQGTITVPEPGTSLLLVLSTLMALSSAPRARNTK